jgi:hypothetical protein
MLYLYPQSAMWISFLKIIGLISVWTLIVLILLPCLGSKHVGFFSKAAFTTVHDVRRIVLIQLITMSGPLHRLLS